MKNTSIETTLERQPITDVLETKTTDKVDVVVQEYMDTLLCDLFPDMSEPAEQTADSVVDKPVTIQPQTLEAIEPAIHAPSLVQGIEPKVEHASDLIVESKEEALAEVEVKSEAQVKTYAKVIPHVPLNEELLAPSIPDQPLQKKVEEKPPVVVEIPEIKATVTPVVVPEAVTENKVEPEVKLEVKPDIEKLFPNAPDWAQEAFDVLLFDVCGLKLAVPMESLGKIIKVAHETNQLIGRPNWFLGAYNDDAEEHLYVVDTAQYIMPEKGHDLVTEGYDYIIQMQRSKWTLACQNVHTTVRLQPDQVKWRSNQGKRQWLSGTVIEHMCALVHVDKLVELLEADS